MNTILKISSITILFLGLGAITAKAPIVSSANIPSIFKVSVLPSYILQGEPFMIQVGEIDSNEIENILMDDTSLYFSDYKNIPTAFVGIDLNKKPGVYKIKTTLKDGRFEENTITIIERKKYEEAMPIPVAIGGNSIINQTRVVNTLAQENEILNTLKTSTTSLWIKNFSYPVTNPIITDTYGYARNTGGYAIAHKGTDFRAKVGTPILAMNDGIVRVSKDFTVYGGTIVIDHGQGIMTLYMHLSKRDVSTGDKVISGQTIGLSGGTGYAEGPHLHLSIKINNISIDPMKFIELFEKS